MRFADRQCGQIGNAAVFPAYRQRVAIQALAMAGRAGLQFVFFIIRQIFPGIFFTTLFFVEAAEFDAGAEAGVAPAMLGVIGEQTWIRFRETRAAGRAGTLGGKVLLLQFAGLQWICRVQIENDAHGAVAGFQRTVQGLLQTGLGGRGNDEIGHRQLDRMFLVAIQSGPGFDRNEVTVNTQVGIAFAFGPFSQIGIVTFASGDQWCQDADVPALAATHDAGKNLFL